MPDKTHTVLQFTQIDQHDTPVAGKKAVWIAEYMDAGFRMPPGFIISSNAYHQFIRENKLAPKIHQLISTTNFDRPESLSQISNHIKKLICQAPIPHLLVKDINQAYTSLGGLLNHANVTVQSSLINGDTQHSNYSTEITLPDIHGEANLMMTIKELWAGIFSPELLQHSHHRDADLFSKGIAIIVQRMLDPEKSGTMLTLNPVTNDKSKIIIEGLYGSGEIIKQEEESPDHYEISKSELTVTGKMIAHQDFMIKRIKGKIQKIRVPAKEAGIQKITQNQLVDLALMGIKMEKTYYFPQEIHWAVEKNVIYITQVRPLTNEKTKKESSYTTPTQQLLLLLKGIPVSPGLVNGPLRIIQNAKDLEKVEHGDILVFSRLERQYIPFLKKAKGIITDRGGQTTQNAIIAREFGIPAVFGTKEAIKSLTTGQIVSLNGTTGEIYKGAAFKSRQETFETHPGLRTATKLYVTLTHPSLSEKIAKQEIDGVGLLRGEFILSDINIHPKKLISDGNKQIYTEKLADQIEKVCTAFGSRPVIYRASDFKTAEYRDLKEGKYYEDDEPNPLLGFRGAYRFIHDPQVFELELQAINIVRNKRDINNLWFMVPFVRSVHELVSVKRILTENGLHRSHTFKLWMMAEIPSNVVLLDKFIEAGIDGVCIGSNDLTMLMLGTDRENDNVAQAFNSLDPAVLWAYEHIIKTAHKHHLPVTISGHAPAMHPSLLEKLISWGISGVTIPPELTDTIREYIAKTERKLIEEK